MLQIRIKAEVDVVELTDGDIGPYTFNNTLKFEEAKKYNKELQQIISRSRNPKLDRAFGPEINNEDTLTSEDALILKDMVSVEPSACAIGFKGFLSSARSVIEGCQCRDCKASGFSVGKQGYF